MNKHLQIFLLGLICSVIQCAIIAAIVTPAYLSYSYNNNAYLYFYLIFTPIIPLGIYSYGCDIENRVNKNEK